MELLVAFFAESCYIERQRGLRGRDSNMRIIIVGDGKMGSTFAQRLSKAGHDARKSIFQDITQVIVIKQTIEHDF